MGAGVYRCACVDSDSSFNLLIAVLPPGNSSHREFTPLKFSLLVSVTGTPMSGFTLPRSAVPLPSGWLYKFWSMFCSLLFELGFTLHQQTLSGCSLISGALRCYYSSCMEERFNQIWGLTVQDESSFHPYFQEGEWRRLGSMKNSQWCNIYPIWGCTWGSNATAWISSIKKLSGSFAPCCREWEWGSVCRIDLTPEWKTNISRVQLAPDKSITGGYK